MDFFNVLPMWVQVWHISHHWLSIKTGKKIGNMLGLVQDVMIVESRGKEDSHVKILVELNLTKPLLRGTMLKYKHCELWVEFKYKLLPIFCFYCGIIGHKEKNV